MISGSFSSATSRDVTFTVSWGTLLSNDNDNDGCESVWLRFSFAKSTIIKINNNIVVAAPTATPRIDDNGNSDSVAEKTKIKYLYN